MQQKTKKTGGKRFNATKLRSLAAFESAFPEPLTPEEYARRTGFRPARAAYTYLRRLEKFGLLVRLIRPVRYKITAKGRRRLAWLRLG